MSIEFKTLPDGTPKSALTTPEKITTWLLVGGIGALLFRLWGTILPFIIQTMESTLYFGVLVGVFITLFAILSNKSIRTAGFFLFKMAMRKMAGLVWTINPIEVMKISIDEAKLEREKLSEQINIVAEQDGKIDLTIKENNDKIRQKFAEANKAIQMGEDYKQLANLAAIEAGGLQDFNQRLQPMKDNTEKVLSFLEKVYKASDYLIKEMEIKVSLKEKEYSIVKATSSAMKTAVRLFNGELDSKYAFIQASDYIQEDMGRKLGEMKRAMQLSSDFVKGVDIQNGVYSEKGIALLEQYNNGGLTLINELPKGTIIHFPKQTSGKSSTTNLLD
jgi:predicted RNA-binding protein with RPS1 domain